MERNRPERIAWSISNRSNGLSGFAVYYEWLYSQFCFSLADHAGNGFFFAVEWVPVGASAVAIGFLSVPLMMQVSRLFIDVSAAILVLEAAVGLWGFVLHTTANLQGPSVHAFDNFVYGAPPTASLLFPNLMVLGIIGLWQLRKIGGPAPSVAATQKHLVLAVSPEGPRYLKS